MSSPATAFKDHGRRARGLIHLPSVHIRTAEGTGFDYEEDICIRGRGKRRQALCKIRFVTIERGEEVGVAKLLGEAQS